MNEKSAKQVSLGQVKKISKVNEKKEENLS